MTVIVPIIAVGYIKTGAADGCCERYCLHSRPECGAIRLIGTVCIAACTARPNTMIDTATR
jgi:hypothetical protein